jgi:hypothetical protein
VADGPSRDELESWHCWENDDRVGGRPHMTAFRRELRLHQARWRDRNGHPIGTQPIAPKPGKRSRLVGSRMAFDHAERTGANFVTASALAAARARIDHKESHQSLDRQRHWADLLWSPSMAFNLFADLGDDPEIGDHAVRTWWPDAPGELSQVRFAHSPGRLDPAYLNSLRAFDAAIVLDRGSGGQAMVGVGVRYHEWAKPETPRPENRQRYLEVAERSGAFRPGASDELMDKTPLAELWLEHLLLLSMLQHESGAWRWGRYVLVHPEGNTDMAEMCAEYRTLLADDSTFESITVEALLDAGALPPSTADRLRDRYLPD